MRHAQKSAYRLDSTKSQTKPTNLQSRMSDNTKAVVRDPTTQQGHQAFERLRLFSHVLNQYCFRGDQPPDDECANIKERKRLMGGFSPARYIVLVFSRQPVHKIVIS